MRWQLRVYVLDIGVCVLAHDPITFHQLADSPAQAERRLESGGFDPRVADKVVAFVWIFSHLLGYKVEFRNVLLVGLAQLPFTQICVAQSHIEGAPFHLVVVGEGMDKRSSRIADMQIIPFEMRLKQDQESVIDGAESEIVDQQIQPHSGTDAEESRE